MAAAMQGVPIQHSNRVGFIIYVNQGSGTFSNSADINQQIDQENNCNESGDGSSNARCSNTASNRVGPIIYLNQGSGTYSNAVDVNQRIGQENNCSGGAQCSNDGSNLFRLINWNQGSGSFNEEQFADQQIDQANTDGGESSSAELPSEPEQETSTESAEPLRATSDEPTEVSDEGVESERN